MAAGDLTTTAKVNTFGGISGQDALVQVIITGVSRAMASYCGRRFVDEGDMTERHWRDFYSPYLILEEWPVDATSITSVVEGSTTLVAGTGYVLEKDERTLTRLASATERADWATGLTVVTYDVKYAAATPPEDIDLACQKQCVFEYRQTNVGGNRLGDTSKTSPTGDTVGFVPSGWLPDVEQVLRQYRRVF